MPHALAQSVEILTTVLAVCGMGYFLAALLAARVFLASAFSSPSRASTLA